jgi:predicted AAA+ superfamily ATPase
MTRLLKLTAFYAGKLVNLTELGNKPGLDRLTIKKYMALLEQLFLVEQLAVWIDESLNFFHYRDKDKVEVDFIIENATGGCFAVEVKAAATLNAKDFTGLKRFQNILIWHSICTHISK